MRKIRYPLIALLTVILFSNCISAATIKSYSMTYNVDNQSARDMLAMINDWRTGGSAWYWNSDNTTKYQCGKLSALTYDYNLEQIALQRAYEVAVSFSHTRPNGGRGIYLSYNGTTPSAENIAAGNSTTSATFVQWQENNDKYSGQGHRRSMLNSSYTAIGIAHVELNGVHFWVQEFGRSNSGASATSAIKGSKTGTVEIDISSATFSLFASSGKFTSMAAGSSKTLPVISGSYKTTETWGTNGLTVSSGALSNLTWKSSNTSVITISNNKTANAVGSGSCTLTASASCDGKSYSYTMNVTVSKIQINSSDVTYTVPACYYNMGSALTPKPVLTYSGRTLKEGTDYEITGYSNNTAVTRYAYIDISGKGNYTGTRTLTFSINQRNINDCTLSSIPDAEYTGSAVTPDITLTLNGKTLTKGTDYKVTCSSSQLGTATVTITGMNYFTGTRTATFNIVDKRSYNWKQNNGRWYLYDNFGVPAKGFTKVDGIWYFLDDKGAMITEWNKINGVWYYFGGNGAMRTGWQSISGSWYYFGGNGSMRTGWQQINSKWYYFGDSGAMATGWKQIGGKWYFFKESGAMASNEWCDGYWLNADGSWTYKYKASWKKAGNKWWFGDTSGWYAKNGTIKIDDKNYNFDSNGYCTNP